MNSELDKKLVEKYPLIFANRYKPMNETAMCWGFDVGDGWYQILDSLCGNIQNYIDWKNRSATAGYNNTEPVEQVVADQVKEKFGGLRFYYTGGDAEIRGMVQMAESWASVTCETCGSPGRYRHGGWIRTLCDTHAEEMDTTKMTVPIERTNAVVWTGEFLQDLIDPSKTPRVPKSIRQQALRLLRHYPNKFEMDFIARCEDATVDPFGYKIFGKDYK